MVRHCWRSYEYTNGPSGDDVSAYNIVPRTSHGCYRRVEVPVSIELCTKLLTSSEQECGKNDANQAWLSRNQPSFQYRERSCPKIGMQTRFVIKGIPGTHCSCMHKELQERVSK